MIQIDDIQALNNYDWNELLPNGDARYVQLIQFGLPSDEAHPEGRVIDMDFDRLQRQAILIEEVNRRQGSVFRVSGRVLAKELIRERYGIRRFKLTNIWRQIERRRGDPKLMDMAFPEMYDRYDLLQFDIQRREDPVQR